MDDDISSRLDDLNVLDGDGCVGRAVEVCEWLLAGLDDRGEVPVYSQRLGYLLLVFEVFYWVEVGEGYVGMEMGEDDRNELQLEVVREALVDVLDEHPNRVAFPNSQRTRAVYGWDVKLPDGGSVEFEVLGVVLDECYPEGGEVSVRELKEFLRGFDGLPWVRE